MISLLLLASPLLIHAAGHSTREESNSEALRFLEEVVRADFNGDAFPRIGHVYDELQLLAKGDVKGPSFEVYLLDSDPLVVVDQWEFVGIQTKASLTCGQYRFRIVAETIGSGLPSWITAESRHIRALQPPKRETVAYCLRFDGAKWMLVDPPIPRVGLPHILDAMKDSTARSEKIRSEVKHASPRAILNIQRVADSLREQLSVLESL